MTPAITLRYLGHDGNFHYYTGTDNAGEPQFSLVPAVAKQFMYERDAVRILRVCEAAGHTMELVRA